LWFRTPKTGLDKKRPEKLQRMIKACYKQWTPNGVENTARDRKQPHLVHAHEYLLNMGFFICGFAGRKVSFLETTKKKKVPSL